ncbi:hypothetical protein AC579_5350 [Pseudocercospora musae]|uniref:Uncharacterized protein n=1 Tax=Pseudocercospora musae TaxID=113226 RepID=A0A139ITA3_9PEZI|nr:hypothetical protein AC579_5350 [Pseudocercospora musae]KXT17843.1 hypothetical protein AC579_5350 [Pseudocercospora musae]KXT17844.1 hypothetical protein AC579_5350 [Pseudocercospora musae]
MQYPTVHFTSIKTLGGESCGLRASGSESILQPAYPGLQMTTAWERRGRIQYKPRVWWRQTAAMLVDVDGRAGGVTKLTHTGGTVAQRIEKDPVRVVPWTNVRGTPIASRVNSGAND